MPHCPMWPCAFQIIQPITFTAHMHPKGMVNNAQCGYQYNSSTGTITSANINISKTQEFSRPIVVDYGYYLSVMLVDVEIINAKYPSSYTMS